jgi:hypothetical protein
MKKLLLTLAVSTLALSQAMAGKIDFQISEEAKPHVPKIVMKSHTMHIRHYLTLTEKPNYLPYDLENIPKHYREETFHVGIKNGEDVQDSVLCGTLKFDMNANYKVTADFKQNVLTCEIHKVHEGS